MNDSYKILVDKLNNFRKRYYLYKLLRGLLITSLLFIIVYVVVSILEYYTYSSSSIRKIEFFGILLFFVFVALHYILIPVYQLFIAFNKKDRKNLNAIIVNHFGEIKDKLINILELADSSNEQQSKELLLASIHQKINEIKIFDFNKAIRFSQLKYVLFYFLVSVFIVAAILVFDKPLLKESNHRIVNYQQSFQKPAPFEFIFETDSIKITKGQSTILKVRCEGSNIPEVVYIVIGNTNFLMNNKKDGSFEYKLDAVINSFGFYFTDLEYSSKKYYLETQPKPGIQNFTITIDPPDYTKVGQHIVENIGDIKAPEGSMVKWKFKCIDTDTLKISFNSNKDLISKAEKSWFKVSSKITESSTYAIDLVNEYFKDENSILYSIEAVKDLYPQINMVQVKDSTQFSRYYFKGSIEDDYGFSALNFHYNIDNYDSIIPVRFVKSLKEQDYYFTFDFNTINASSGIVSYYFSVDDNDEINGYKSTTSESYIYNIPTTEELSEIKKEQFAEIEKLMNQGKDLANEIRKNVKQLQINTINNNISEWEKSQFIQDIEQQQNKLQDLLKDAYEQNKDLNNLMNSFSEENQEIIEKQEQLQELLDQVLTPELKDLLEEFYKLAEDFDENKLNKLSDQLDMSFDDLSKQLDRNLEMLKKMKVEQELQSVTDQLSKLAIEEEKLVEELLENKDYENIEQKDSTIKSKIDNLREELKDALELNNKLEKPLIFDEFSNEFEDINKGFENNKEELKKQNKNKSSKSIKETSERMKNLAFNMHQMLQTNTMQQNKESIQNLKQILSNLLYMSFSQEDILSSVRDIKKEDPILNVLKRQQNGLINQSLVVKDSLYALAKRVPQVNNLVSGELLDLEINLSSSNELMEELVLPKAMEKQQYVITSLNNLTLMLNEILDQIEEQMANAMPGDQQCENPQGQGGEQLNMLKSGSEGMKQQLQQMIEEMKKGNSKQMSKMLGESLMQHEMMQKMLRDLMQNGQVGSSAMEQLKQIDDILEQNKRDLMNKNVSVQTVNRHNQILTRLLEAQNAEIERDMDEKRESQTADEEFFSNPLKYFEYTKNNVGNIEQIDYGNQNIKAYYTKKYKDYLKTLEETNVRK